MRRDKKRQINWYQINDSDAIARHLEKMAMKGWFLEKAGNFTWSFRRDEPRQIHYTITYFPGASVFDAAPAEPQQTYIDYCSAAGWEFVTAYGPIQYFRSGQPSPVPIETDEQEKLRIIRRTMRKTLVLCYTIFILAQLVYLWSSWQRFLYSPLRSVGSSEWLATTTLFLVFILYLAAILIDYFIWLFRSKRAVEQGGSCVKVHTKARLWGGFAMLAVLAADLLLFLVPSALQNRTAVLFLYCGIGIALIMAAPRLVMWQMKKHGCSRGATRWTYVGMTALLTLVFVGGMTSLSGYLVQSGATQRTPAYTYTASTGWQHGIYLDPLPVTLEDLGYPVADEDHCTYTADEERSLLASYGRYTQQAISFESHLPTLTYEVCRIRWDWLRRACWDVLLNASTQYSDPYYVQPVEPLPEGALEARCDMYGRRYAALYPDRIILITAGWDITEDEFSALLGALR